MRRLRAKVEAEVEALLENKCELDGVKSKVRERERSGLEFG